MPPMYGWPEETGSRAWLSLLGVVLCLGALASLLWQSASNQPGNLWLLAGMLGTAFAVEAGFRRFGRDSGRSRSEDG